MTVMDLLTLGVVVAFILGALVFVSRNLVFVSGNLPPGPVGLPFVGYTPFLGKYLPRSLLNLKRKYGGVICLRLGLKPVVFLNDYKAIHEALIKQGDVFAGRPRTEINKIISYGYRDVVFNDGPVYREQKRFSMQVLRELGLGQTSLENVVMTEVDRLTEYLESREGLPIDVSTMFFVAVMNVIFGITAGRRFEMMDENVHRFKELFRYIGVPKYTLVNFIPFLRFLSPGKMGYDELQSGVSKVRRFLTETIADHERNFQENNLRDFIDYYLAEIKRHQQNGDAEPPYTNDNLEGTMYDMFFAGTDSSDTTLCWSILYMILNPEIQKRVQAELDEAVSRDSTLPTNSATLAPYTRATLFEIQRHATTVPLPSPRQTMADTTFLGYRLPKGTQVFINIFALHHDEDYWNDPEVFRPERFLDESGQVLKHDRYMPFGAGPRVCLGESLAKMELFLFFTCLMRRFSFHPVAGQPLPSMEPECTRAAIIKPKAFSFTVKRRV